MNDRWDEVLSPTAPLPPQLLEPVRTPPLLLPPPPELLLTALVVPVFSAGALVEVEEG